MRGVLLGVQARSRPGRGFKMGDLRRYEHRRTIAHWGNEWRNTAASRTDRVPHNHHFEVPQHASGQFEALDYPSASLPSPGACRKTSILPPKACHISSSRLPGQKHREPSEHLSNCYDRGLQNHRRLPQVRQATATKLPRSIQAILGITSTRANSRVSTAAT